MKLTLRKAGPTGYKLDNRYKWMGMDISVENEKGTMRSGMDADGHVWRTIMNYPYGYIRATEGVDGDHVDVYVGPHLETAEKVYIVHQNDPTTGAYDEDKCMVGFSSAEDAKQAYLSQYDRPGFYGSMTTVNCEEFKDMLKRRYGMKLKKAKSKPIGSVSTHGGRKVRKTPKGWVPVSEGKKSGPSAAEYVDTVTDAHNGQVDAMAGLRTPDGDVAAGVSYSKMEGSGDVHVNIIRTMEGFERQGYARELVQRFMDEHKGSRIYWGMTTEEGEKLITQLRQEGVVPEEGGIKKSFGEWFYRSGGDWHELSPVEGFSPELMKRAEPKKYYSPEEVRARGMRWVTINGAHVLLQGTEDGGWTVVGGAGGQLNHMKVDRILNEEEYRERQRERKNAAEKEKRERLTKEEYERRKKEEREADKKARDVRKQAREQYKNRVEDILGDKIENILSEEDMKKIDSQAKERVKRKERAAGRESGGGEGSSERSEKDEKKYQEKVQKERQLTLQQAVNRKIKSLEHEANRLLTGDYEGDGAPNTVSSESDQQNLSSLDQARDLLKEKKKLQDFNKSVQQEKEDLDKLKVSEALAGETSYSDEDIDREVRQNIETAKNINFYSEINAHHDRVAKYMSGGASRAMNGIMSDLYGTGASFNADLVKELGVEPVARAIAHKLQLDGKGDTARESLRKYSDQVREKTVDQAMNRAEEAYEDVEKIMEGAGGDAPMYSKMQANAKAIRHYQLAYNELGSASGSLRAMAHVINALDDPPNDTIELNLGRSEDVAKKKMKRAGFGKDQYSLRKGPDGQYTAEIGADEIAPFFERNQEQRTWEEYLNDIRRHKHNTGELAPGMKEGNQWGFDPKKGEVDPDLANAQESGFHFAKEKDKCLLDYTPGAGKTYISSSLIGDAMSRGAEKILVAVPANLKDQTSDEIAKFLDEKYGSQVKNLNPRMSPEERRAAYEDAGIHVVSHNALQNDKESLHSQNWDMVIADEIHDLINSKKSSDSKQFESLSGLSKNTKRVVGMTGTPIKTDKREAWKAAKLMGSEESLGAMSEFEKRHKDINQTTSAFANSEKEAFRKEMAKFSYSQNFTPSVEKKESKVGSKLSSEQRQEVARIEADYKRDQDAGKKGASGHRDANLWRVTHLHGGRNNPKFQDMVSHMRENPNAKGLVFFSQGASKEGAIQYAKQLNQEFGDGIAASVSSSTSRTQLRKLKERVNDPGDSLQYLVGTETLATGHNLQGASMVYKVDVPLSKAQDDQQTARSYRNGQTSDVNVVYLNSNDPNDINKRYNLRTKGRESELMGNPSTIAGMAEDSFGAVVRAYEQDAFGE